MIFENIEVTAEKILEKNRIESIPIPVEEIIERMGIKIGKAPSDRFSGMVIRKDGGALIGINSREPRTRQRFSLGHELGHFVLHKEKDTFVDYRDTNTPVRTPREREADMFAAALLMPRNSLKKDFKEIPGGSFTEERLGALAEKYGVSEIAMKFRIMNLLHWLNR